MRVAFVLFFLSLAASASDLSIKIVDPHSAPVAGAQVSLIESGHSKIVATAISSAEGLVTFHLRDAGPYAVKVLAPGFATESGEATTQRELTIALRLAPASETVVVTATRTPVAGESSGSD